MVEWSLCLLVGGEDVESWKSKVGAAELFINAESGDGTANVESKENERMRCRETVVQVTSSAGFVSYRTRGGL